MDTITRKRLQVLIFTGHRTRRRHLAGITAHPAGTWAAQHARNLAIKLGARMAALRLLIRGRDTTLTAAFDDAVRAGRIRTSKPRHNLRGRMRSASR